jgi:hypothetical protein
MAMDHNHYSDILTKTAARLTENYQAEQQRKAHSKLVGALRSIPRDRRQAEAEAAIKRLAKQEVLEAKLKMLSGDDLDEVQID